MEEGGLVRANAAAGFALLGFAGGGYGGGWGGWVAGAFFAGGAEEVDGTPALGYERGDGASAPAFDVVGMGGDDEYGWHMWY